MVDSIGNVSVQTAEPVQKKKSGAGKTLLGTVIATGVGGTAGRFAANKMFDSFIKEAEAAIANPDILEKKMLKGFSSIDSIPKEAMERAINEQKELIPKLKSAKTKWTFTTALAGGILYLLGKAIFGKKHKAENVA